LEAIVEEYNNLSLYYCKYKKENEKLKQAIKILKDKKVSTMLLWNSADVDDHNLYRREKYCLTIEEYELLKEVLGNV